MKYFNLLPLAALTSALVLPDQQIFSDIVTEADHRQAQAVGKASSTKDDILAGFKSHYEQVSDTVKESYDELSESVKDTSAHVKSYASNALDDVLSLADAAGTSLTDAAFDAKSWAEDSSEYAWDALKTMEDHEHPPHHGPPHHGPPHHGPPDERKPVHPPHHGKPNQTVYQLISKSKYTTKLAKLINDYPDIVSALNSTDGKFTVFAPTDTAFEKIPDHAPKPSKEQLLKVLNYHIVPDFYPAGRVLVTHTVPTLLIGDHLTDHPAPQRLSINIGLRGLTLNFYSRVVAVDIFGTNGVIHGIDSILIPPPNVIKIIDLLPSEFSTLELALGKTGLLEEFNTTHHPGGTLFAPSNFAFQKLGPRINAFLFSPYGQKYLKALLQYHVVPGTTLYSDAIYQAGSDSAVELDNRPKHWLNTKPKGCSKKAMKKRGGGHHGGDDDHHGPPHKGPHKGPHHGGPPHRIPKGYWHYDLPTLFEDKTLNVDIARYGRLIGIKVNGFSTVIVEDGIAEDGVIQVVGDVLIPPKNQLHPPHGAAEEHGWTDKVKGLFGKVKSVVVNEDMSVEEFKSRFAGLVEDDE